MAARGDAIDGSLCFASLAAHAASATMVAPTDVSPPSLMIAMPCRAEIRAAVFPALLQCIISATSYWHRRFGDAMVTTQILPRTHVVTARNLIAAEARAGGIDWVLWLDDDMAPPADLLERLHGTARPFVGAVAYRREPPFQPCVARIVENRAEPFDPEPGPDGPVVPADLTGFACVLTHRSVLDAVWQRTDGRPFALVGDVGEDFHFCLQARKAGIQLHILSDCVVGHAGDLIVGREHRLAALAAE